MNSRFPIVAGVFEIFFAGICMSFSTVFLLFIPLYGVFPEYVCRLDFPVYGVVVSVFGLMGGIFALERRHFALALIGACLIMFWGIWFAWLGVSKLQQYEPLGTPSDPWSQAVIIGTATVMFSILSVTFLLSSRTEFQ